MNDDACTCCGMTCSTMLVAVGAGGMAALELGGVTGALVGIQTVCVVMCFWLTLAEWFDR